MATQSGKLRERNRDTLDPVVQTHPTTSERPVYVSHAVVKEVPGMAFEAGMDVVMQIVDATTAPHLVYKHNWRRGDIIVFDNRNCLHTPFPYAFDDFPRTRCLLYQIIIGGRDA